MLVDVISAAGFSDESVRIFLATGTHRRRPPRRARRGSRPDAAVVPARRGGRHGARRRDRQFPCSDRDSGRPHRQARRPGGAPVDTPWPDRSTRFAARHGRRVTIRRSRCARRPASGLPGPPDDRARGGRQHAQLLPAGSSPLRRAPGGAGHRRRRARSPKTTSASSWCRCAWATRISAAWPLSAVSAARALIAVRGFHRFAAAEGLTASDVARAVKPPTPSRRLPKSISLDEVVALLEGAGGDSETDGPLTLRNRALLEVLYSTGARISEAVGLDVDDVDTAVAVGAAARQGRQAATGADRAAGGQRARRVPRPRATRPGAPRQGHAARSSSTPAADGCRGKARGRCCRTPPSGQASRRRCHRTRCGTRSPRTCSRAAPTSASSRSCSATPRSPRRRSTRW